MTVPEGATEIVVAEGGRLYRCDQCGWELRDRRYREDWPCEVIPKSGIRCRGPVRLVAYFVRVERERAARS